MKKEKNIPLRNYIILAIVLIFSIVIMIYFYMWYSEIEKTNLSNPIMDDYLNVINYNEINDYLVENNDVIIYVSVLDNQKTRNFEKKFKKLVDDYSLNNHMLYLNLTDKNKNTINNFRKDYNIASFPSIVIFKNGNVVDTYDIEYSDYDINLLISYLKIRGVIND